MKSNYAINSELKKLRNLNLPTNRFIAGIVNAYLTLLPGRIYKKRVKYETFNVNGIKMHMFTPKDHKYRPTPCIYYIHGGGFMYKASDIQYHLEQTYAIECCCRVIGIDYRLMPKYRYPAPEEDCFMGYKYILEHAKELKVDTERLVIAGDSAGGLLAQETYLSAKADRLKEPKGLMLIYPVTDHKSDTPSAKEFLDTPVWNGTKNVAMWKRFLNGTHYYSPLDCASQFELENVFVEVEEFDCLHDEGKKLYELISPHVDNAIIVDNKGTFHAFDANKKSKFCRDVIYNRCVFLKSCFEEE